MARKIISALQHVKDENGDYVLILPINTSEDVMMDLTSGETLSDRLIQMREELDDTKLTVIEDLGSVVNALAGLIDVNLPLNHIYRENFRTTDNILKTSGTFFEGGVKALQNETIDFRFINPIDLPAAPKNFKINHVSSYIGSPSITCQITFNAKDTKPTWFNCNDVFASGLFADVPEIPNKDEDKPYSINFRFKCSCNASSTFEIVDLSILHV